MNDLEDERLVGYKELEDGGALPLLQWKIHLLHIWYRISVLGVQPNKLDQCIVQKLLLDLPDPLLHLVAWCVKVTLKLMPCSSK
jgi:hypothetical protein